MAGWYELTNSSDGQFRFVLKAGNAEIILTSELYKTRASAENGISSVQNNCQADERYDRKESANNKFYFNLKAGRLQVLSATRLLK
ncbi:MAG: YegP family protein [Gammaproteobacteria bacterium]|nr:YegP family protein [Gammaproteobacteria bacterium]